MSTTKYTSKLLASRILIIGGTSGLGLAVAEACLEHGAHVAISSSNPTRISAAVSKLQSTYPSSAANIHGLTVDLSSPSTLETQLEQVLSGATQKLSSNGKLDHIVYTAGDALARIPVGDMSYENIVQAGQIRYFAPLLLGKFVERYLEQSHRSSYTITTGSISERPNGEWSVIAGYAAGIHGVVRNLALDVKPVRVSHSLSYP
jgi:NAD(P)-dependent dehydrogenase (short-subunit alcohol dehydrogenase family)